MGLIKKLIVTFIGLVVLAVAAVLGGYFYVKSTYGIDVLDTISQMKTLSEEVDEGTLCPNAFTEEDTADLQAEVNKSVENFITYSAEHGYVVNFDELPEEMKQVVKLTDRQVGSLAQTIVQQELGGQIDVGGEKIGLKLLQVDFSEVSQGSAAFNAVVRLDITSLKAKLGEFPLSLVQDYVPDYFYVSSTVWVEKGSEFAYDVSHRALTINNLSPEETEGLFQTLDKVVGIGSANALNEQIGSLLMGTLVGSDTQKGLAYSLKELGVSDYTFLEEGGEEYFALVCDGLPF